MNEQTINTKHYVALSLKVSVPDGLYIPLDKPITEEERESMLVPEVVGSEIALYLQKVLENIGVVVEYLGITDNYSLKVIRTQE